MVPKVMVANYLQIQCLSHSSSYPLYPRRHCQYCLTLQIFLPLKAVPHLYT